MKNAKAIKATNLISNISIRKDLRVRLKFLNFEVPRLFLWAVAEDALNHAACVNIMAYPLVKYKLSLLKLLVVVARDVCICVGFCFSSIFHTCAY